MKKILLAILITFPSVASAFPVTDTLVLCATDFGDESTNGYYECYNSGGITDQAYCSNGIRSICPDGNSDTDDQSFVKGDITCGSGNYYDGTAGFFNTWSTIDNGTEPAGTVVQGAGTCEVPAVPGIYNPTNAIEDITTTFSGAGALLAVVFGSILVGLVGLFGIGYGVRKLTMYITGPSWDRSGTIGGFYYARTPYKGYNRWRSRKWNMEHTA